MPKKLKSKHTIEVAKKRLNNAAITATDINSLDIRREFIDKFTMCELACKTMLEGYCKYIGTYSQSNNVKLSMKQIPGAVALHGLTIQNHILNGIFGGSGQYKKRNIKSAKKLRDGVLHTMNNKDVQEIVTRNNELTTLMNTFLSFF